MGAPSSEYWPCVRPYIFPDELFEPKKTCAIPDGRSISPHELAAIFPGAPDEEFHLRGEILKSPDGAQQILHGGNSHASRAPHERCAALHN